MTWKTGGTLAALAAGLLALSEPARAEGNWGPCEPMSGSPYQYNPLIDWTLTSPQNNSKGKVFRDFYFWDLGSSYKGRCECPVEESSSKTENTRPVYIQAISSLPIDHQEGNETYFTINEFLAFSAEVYIAGLLNQYIKAPFTDVSNESASFEPCRDIGYDFQQVQKAN